MYYTIYKITNQINGKFYIGSHKTKDLNDDYMGSGKYLLVAQEKYGIKNFKKEILFVFDTAEEMFAKEAEIVNEDFLATENTYNLKKGGFGGFDYINDKSKFDNPSHSHLHCTTISPYGTKKHVEMGKNEGWFSKGGKVSKAKLVGIHDPTKKGSFKGKTHTIDTKKKIGANSSYHQQGEKNSQYGTLWITDGKLNKKIKSTDIIPEGWIKGRNLRVKSDVA